MPTTTPPPRIHDSGMCSSGRLHPQIFLSQVLCLISMVSWQRSTRAAQVAEMQWALYPLMSRPVCRASTPVWLKVWIPHSVFGIQSRWSDLHLSLCRTATRVALWPVIESDLERRFLGTWFAYSVWFYVRGISLAFDLFGFCWLVRSQEESVNSKYVPVLQILLVSS
jgi:hypothetical protein